MAQQKLSLSKAIQIGLMNNFEIKIARQSENIALSNKKFGEPGKYPTIRFNMRQSNRISFDSSPTSFVDGAYTNNQISAGVDASWTLFEGFRVRISEKRLEQLVEQSQGNAELVVQNTIHAIILAYYQTLIEKEKLKAVERTTNFSYKKLQNGKTLFNSGNISKYDLLNLDNAFLSDSINFQNQNIQYDQAVVRLNFVMGSDKNKRYELTDPLEFDAAMVTYKTLEQRVSQNNQDIKNEYLNLKLLENQMALIKTARKPSISLRSGLSEELSTSRFGGAERDNGAVFDYYISFSMNYTIFDGRRVKRELQAAEIEQQMAHLTISDKLLKIKQELQTNYNVWQQRVKILQTQERLIKNLKESLSIMKDRYDGGYAIFIEYRDAQLMLLNAELRKLETIYEIKIAETEIIRLTGGLLKMKKGGKVRGK